MSSGGACRRSGARCLQGNSCSNWLPRALAALLASAVAWPALGDSQDVADAPINIASVLDLEGRSRGLGLGMREGIEAALHGLRIGGRPVKLHFLNDGYTPNLTAIATRAALRLDLVAMIGNTGTPTAAVSLPLLQHAGVPAIGFFTGADLLRTKLSQGVFNVRASYDQEISRLVEHAVENGIGAHEICALAQNDTFGEAGLRGLAAALDRVAGGGSSAAAAVRATLAIDGHSSGRNGHGPVGYFERERPAIYHGYLSLKAWESGKGMQCRLVLTVGTYASIGRFQSYSRLKLENWVIAALSFTGAESLGAIVGAGPPDDRIVMMQVVPPLDSSLQIVADARAALGRSLGFISLEGYMVGRLVREALEGAPGDVTPRTVAARLRGNRFDIGGTSFDFSTDNQGLDSVYLTYLSDSGWRPLPDDQWQRWFPEHQFAWLSRWFK